MSRDYLADLLAQMSSTAEQLDALRRAHDDETHPVNRFYHRGRAEGFDIALGMVAAVMWLRDNETPSPPVAAMKRTLAEQLDAAAAVPDQGEAFGAVINNIFDAAWKARDAE